MDLELLKIINNVKNKKDYINDFYNLLYKYGFDKVNNSLELYNENLIKNLKTPEYFLHFKNFENDNLNDIWTYCTPSYYKMKLMTYCANEETFNFFLQKFIMYKNNKMVLFLTRKIRNKEFFLKKSIEFNNLEMTDHFIKYVDTFCIKKLLNDNWNHDNYDIIKILCKKSYKNNIIFLKNCIKNHDHKRFLFYNSIGIDYVKNICELIEICIKNHNIITFNYLFNKIDFEKNINIDYLLEICILNNNYDSFNKIIKKVNFDEHGYNYLLELCENTSNVEFKKYIILYFGGL